MNLQIKLALEDLFAKCSRAKGKAEILSLHEKFRNGWMRDRRVKVTAEKKRMVIDLDKEGCSIAEISFKTDISTPTVRKILKGELG